MDAQTESELDTFLSLQTGIQVFHGIEDTQARSYRSLGVIFMRLGIAKIDQETVAQELSGVSFIALDDFSTDFLVCAYHVPIVFGIEFAGEFGGIDEITEHYRELPSFRVRRRGSRERCDQWGVLFRCSRLWYWLSKVRGDFLSASSVASPDETPPFVISHWVHVKEFILQVVEIIVIKVKASLEGTIRY